MAHLCLDLGGTKSVAALFDDDGRELGRARCGPGALSLGSDVTLGAVRAIWAELERFGQAAAQTDIAIGLAGIGLRDRVAKVRAELGEFRNVTCVSDGYGALVDATGGRPGILIAVGTGVAAMRLNEDGTCLYASGWGFPGGDLGGGAWIGLQAIGALTRYLDSLPADGAGMSASMAQSLLSATGHSAPELMAWLTRGKAADYASLAPIVLGEAEAGDPLATRLMERAAAELRDVAQGLRQGNTLPIALSGGLAQPILRYLQRSAPHLDCTLSRADPLQGLLLMARGMAPAERPAPRPGLGQPDYSV